MHELRHEKQLGSMEVCYFQKMMKISRISKAKNEKISEQIGDECKCYKNISEHLRFLRHIIREDGLEKLALESKINGPRSRGRHWKIS